MINSKNIIKRIKKRMIGDSYLRCEIDNPYVEKYIESMCFILTEEICREINSSDFENEVAEVARKNIMIR